jgi:hypothetical protein
LLSHATCTGYGEEKAAYEEERAAARAKRMKDAGESKAKKKGALTAPHGVVLDLEFGSLMQDKEMRSMAKQLSFCYSVGGCTSCEWNYKNFLLQVE